MKPSYTCHYDEDLIETDSQQEPGEDFIKTNSQAEYRDNENFVPLYEHFGLHYNKSLINTDKRWALCKERYDRYMRHADPLPTKPRIPKIIHQIQLGNPFPEKYRAIQKTWQDLHPDWVYMLWTDKEVEAFGLTNKVQYDHARNYGEKSDIARYEILYRIGGLYIDTDFECLKPFDIFHYYCDFYAGLGYGTCFEVFNGLIGCRPGHPIMKYVIDRISNMNHFSRSSLNNTGPLFFGNACYEKMKTYNGPAVLFPITYFYPWPAWERFTPNRSFIEGWVQSESYAIHHWAVSWDTKPSYSSRRHRSKL
jgi:mannosyltransferase OCH1-like enzyme